MTNKTKLAAEIRAALGRNVDVGQDGKDGAIRLDFEPQGDRTAHADGWLYVGTPSRADLDTVAAVIAAHDPDAPTEEDIRKARAVALRRKLERQELMTPAEKDEALALALRMLVAD